MTAVLACFVVLGGLMFTAQTQLSMTRRSVYRTAATLVAEGGIEDALNTLSGNWNATTGGRTIYEDPGTNLSSAGTFSYTIQNLSQTKRLITSIGTGRMGQSATVVGVAEYNSGDAISLARYALLADQYVSFGGSSTVQTTPLNGHNADARTNGYISQGGSATIDGTLYAVGTISGSGYYANQPGYASVNFPDEEQLDSWESEWRTQSQSASRSYTTATMPSTITAPAYINGNVSLNGKATLTITGSGVVFIDGSLSLNSQTKITNSATLVVRDSFTCNGQAYYTIPAATLTPTEASGLWTATLVNLYGDLQLNGGGDATGIIYSARGNMRVNGGADYRGSLIAGGRIETVGSYNQYYSGNMRSNITFPVSLRLTKIVEP